MVLSGRLMEQLTQPLSSPGTLYGLYRQSSKPSSPESFRSPCTGVVGDSDAESVATTGSGDSASFLRWLCLESGGGSNKTSGYPLSCPPSTLSIDDALDDSGQQAKHDTGSTCVQRIDVGPSISQKCASDNCKYAEMVQIS